LGTARRRGSEVNIANGAAWGFVVVSNCAAVIVVVAAAARISFCIWRGATMIAMGELLR